MKNEIERIKIELENQKKQNEDLSEKDYDKETYYDKKSSDKLKENDRLTNTIFQLKETINKNILKYDNENKSSKQLIDKLHTMISIIWIKI